MKRRSRSKMCIEAAPAAGGAVEAAENLRHHPLGVGAARDRMTVRPVGPDQVVVGSHHRRGPDDRRLLADRQMEKAAGLGALVLATCLLLEAADQGHLAEQLATRVLVRELRLRRGLPLSIRRSSRPPPRLGLALCHCAQPTPAVEPPPPLRVCRPPRRAARPLPRWGCPPRRGQAPRRSPPAACP